jgi:hypothetical protein
LAVCITGTKVAPREGQGTALRDLFEEFTSSVLSRASEGSINRGGQFQKNIEGIEVEVKDKRVLADTDGWGYFAFDAQRKPAVQLPKTATCYACHGTNAAVEHTFVQFYPTLIDIAKTHGT